MKLTATYKTSKTEFEIQCKSCFSGAMKTKLVLTEEEHDIVKEWHGNTLLKCDRCGAYVTFYSPTQRGNPK